ncbi:Alkanesulfonates ABC transporter ATP-binding protein [Hyphomicrobium sulfonivorans]|uniref:Alkanesulfonates ABC transporter ATP-binding protein n=1 Tax=Hyphomicrobium sulfonivorans TaxID=121290 RepID=A0A109BHU4_HYPSL|nr:ABC transporter ATP-binding protein [Hyphomicrobium sulfonivorans]KWT69066.1 Alkanesulfonates ABC transporter ATP-binding protein [Hyphomicrobium sulfonivorans]
MLHIGHVSKAFARGGAVLADVDLTVERGESVAIVGASGCGKSTLLRIIAGLEPPSRGTVTVAGEEIRTPHPAVGMIFQEPRLLPWLTVAENIAFGITSLPASERTARVQEALDLIGLVEHASKWPRELSGGQSQRVAIARALVARPSVILLDEPFSALDAVTRVDLQRHMRALGRRMHLTLVIVTHDLEEALILGDRVAIMQPNPGRIAKIVTVPGDGDTDLALRELASSFAHLNGARNAAILEGAHIQYAHTS